MTRDARRHYYDLARSRRALYRKLKELREAHRPTDRILAELVRVTAEMLVMEAA